MQADKEIFEVNYY